jgi:hypothetical protein
VDEGTQGVRGLARPDSIRVGLGGVFEIPEYVGCAELVLHAVELVVALLPVVHDDRAVQVAADEGPEGGQVPVAEEVIGQQAGARDVQVVLLRLRAGPGSDRVSSPPITRARMISARQGQRRSGPVREARDPPEPAKAGTLGWLVRSGDKGVRALTLRLLYLEFADSTISRIT